MRAPALACTLLLFVTAAGAALADPPHGRGGRPPAPRNTEIVVRIPAPDVVVIRDYYAEHAFCPPGLARKHNGCLPPGQAKRWQVGHPLPREIVFHALPPDLLGRLALASAGTRYVRVGPDILLLSTLTGVVLDAIASLGRG